MNTSLATELLAKVRSLREDPQLLAAVTEIATEFMNASGTMLAITELLGDDEMRDKVDAFFLFFLVASINDIAKRLEVPAIVAFEAADAVHGEV